MYRGQVLQRARRQRPVQLAQRAGGGEAAGALDLGAFELTSEERLEPAQRLARQPVAARIARGQLGLGLGAQSQRAPDALHVHADHTGALLAARKRRDRHPREVAHRSLRAVPQRGGDLRAQSLELFVGQLVEVQPAGGLLVLLAHPLPHGRQLDRAEEEPVEHQLEHPPVFLALGERGRQRLPEVLLLGPVDLAQHRERVEQLRGPDRYAFAAQLLAELQQPCGESPRQDGVAVRRHRPAP
jgi:hypothetical protein